MPSLVRFITTLGAAAAFAALAAPAWAAPVDQHLSVKVTPAPALASGPAALSVRTWLNPDPADAPYAAQTVTLHFDRSIRFNPKAAPTCTEGTILSAPQQCAKGSLVGTGSARAISLGLPEDLTVSAYNGPGSTVKLLVSGEQPLSILGVINGKLTQPKGKGKGATLKITIPSELQQPAPGAWATLTDFRVTIRRIARAGRAYVAAADCTGRRSSSADFAFSDGRAATAASAQACR